METWDNWKLFDIFHWSASRRSREYPPLGGFWTDEDAAVLTKMGGVVVDRIDGVERKRFLQGSQTERGPRWRRKGRRGAGSNKYSYVSNGVPSRGLHGGGKVVQNSPRPGTKLPLAARTYGFMRGVKPGSRSHGAASCRWPLSDIFCGPFGGANDQIWSTSGSPRGDD